MTVELAMSDITSRYLTANNRPNAPDCTYELVQGFKARLLTEAPEAASLSHVIMFSLAIGAHRLDFVPYLFEDAIKDARDEQQLVHIYNRLMSAIMIIFPSIGGPWCTPPALYMAHYLEAKGLSDVSQLKIREPIGPEDEKAAKAWLGDQYDKSADKGLKGMLGKYCNDFDTLLQTVALGYCHVGTTKSGIFKQHETELVLAAAIAACGATRSARVHGKSALVLGNSLDTVRAVYDLAVAINNWNDNTITRIDVDELIEEKSS